MERLAVWNFGTTLVVGIAGIIIAAIAAVITCDQRRIQEAAVLPLISVQSQLSDNGSTRDLVIQNYGGPLNRPQLEWWPYMTVYLRLPGERDSTLAFLPMDGYESIALKYVAQGVIGKAGLGSHESEFGDQPKAYNDSTVIVRKEAINYLVHLTYDDLRKSHYDCYVIVDSKDFRYVDPRSARQLADSLDARKKNYVSVAAPSSPQSDWLSAASRALPSARRDWVLLRTLKSQSQRSCVRR